MSLLTRIALAANRYLVPRYLVPLLIILLALWLMGCTDPYLAPPAKPGIAVWMTGTPQEVAKACGDRNATACAVVRPGFCTIITRVPDRMDAGFGAIAQHEWAHCSGWVHPKWPNSAAVSTAQEPRE